MNRPVFISAPNIHPGIIAAREEIAKDIWEITLRLETKDFTFHPGQYIWLILPRLTHADARGTRRPFSISSPPNATGELKIVLRKSSSGYHQTLLNMPLGTNIHVRGPQGSSFNGETKKRPATAYAFIAGGVGVAPFLSILQDENIFKKSHAKIALLYAYRDPEAVIGLDALRDLEQRHQHFLFQPVTGKIKKAHLQKIKSQLPQDTIWSVCGPQAFVDAVYTFLCDAGVPEAQMRFEETYPEITKEHRSKIKKLNANLTASQQSTNIFKQAIDQLNQHVVIMDPNGHVVYANKAAEDVTGFSFEEMRGQTPRLWGGLMPPDFYQKLWKLKLRGNAFHGEITNQKKDGRMYPTLGHFSPILSDGKIIGFIATEEDITHSKEVDRVKTEFVSLAAHQLLTPLTAILWQTDLLRAQKIGGLNPKQRECIQSVSEVARRMADMVQSLLQTSRLELGTFVVDPKPTDIQTLLLNTMDEMKKSAEKKHLHISISMHGLPKEIPVDPNLLHVVFLNLISNAVKYTPDGKSVNISLRRTGIKIIFSVKDQGCGVPQQQQKYLFTKMFRAGNAKKIDTSGNGLGLYIVKGIAEASGGSVNFVSKENVGSTFTFTFPAKGMKAKKKNAPS